MPAWDYVPSTRCSQVRKNWSCTTPFKDKTKNIVLSCNHPAWRRKYFFPNFQLAPWTLISGNLLFVFARCIESLNFKLDCLIDWFNNALKTLKPYFKLIILGWLTYSYRANSKVMISFLSNFVTSLEKGQMKELFACWPAENWFLMKFFFICVLSTGLLQSFHCLINLILLNRQFLGETNWIFSTDQCEAQMSAFDGFHYLFGMALKHSL